MSTSRLTTLLLLTAPLLARPVGLRSDYLTNPLGIDTPQPRFSWRSDDTARDWRQSAYQIVVSSSAHGEPGIWDSGKRSSGDSIGILYEGPALQSSRRYFWTVRVWDSKDAAQDAAAPAWFETGLLGPADWTARWISRPDPEAAADRAPIRWIWAAGHDALAVPVKSKAVFRLDVNLGSKPASAALFVSARGAERVSVNGHPAAAKSDFRAFDRTDITDLMTTGKNTIEIEVTAIVGGFPFGPPPKTVPASVAALLKIYRADGTIERHASDATWLARTAESDEFRPAAVIGDLSDTRIGPEPGPLPEPAGLFRREFQLTRNVTRARLYVTALGSYRMYLNGTRAGNDVLTPEYTDYAKRVTYQTYDVTGLLARGPNVMAAIVGEGWFGSGLTWTGLRYSFLKGPTRLLAQLRIDYADGSGETVGSDESWKTAAAPVLHSEIYAGEVYDSRREQAGWNRAGFHDGNWLPAQAAAPPPGVVSAAVALPVRVIETLKPRGITAGKNGAWIVDMGQNMVGWLRVQADGPVGTRIHMRFAEILSPDGSLYTENLRNANATDVLYLRGGPQIWTPMFTFHGFRFVEITGFPGTPSLANFSGETITSAQILTGTLSTSSELVNKMWQVGIWGQRSNFVSIPSDCPQRDERLGWTGDAEVFWRTGAYNADIAAFGHKWVRDVTDDQTPAGAFGNVAPGVAGLGDFLASGAPGWGDAGVIVPWTAWQQYDDRRIVLENWAAMERWMKYIEEGNPDFIRRNRVGPNFGDWLAPDSRTPNDLVATAYWALIAKDMSEMAHGLGRESDATRYSALYANIQTAFQKTYVKDDGSVGPGTQTSYVLALHMKLLPEPLRAAAADKLVREIEAKGWHVSTGFLGTPHLLFALADNGRVDAAYRLLLTDTYPSWGYMIRKGATTWWERWNSDSGDPAMNSFNHYAFGSVVAWIYRYLAGIDTALDGPGFRHIVIHPRASGPISHARGEYDSVYGKIVSDWTRGASGFRLRVTIPANTTASVYLPGKVVTVGSGSYEWAVQ